MDSLNGRRPQPEGRSLRAAGERPVSASRPVVASRLEASDSQSNRPTKTPNTQASKTQPAAKQKAAKQNSNPFETGPLKRVELWVKSNRPAAIGVAIVLMAAIGAGAWALSGIDRADKADSSEVVRHYQKRLPELKSKVKQNPDNASVRKEYAVALYATRDLDESRKQYQEAAKLNPEDPTVYSNLGNVYRDMGQLDKAIGSYKKSIELDPKAVNPYSNMAHVQMYSQGQPGEAIKTYQAALKQMPDNIQFELLLAIAYEQNGDVDKAKSTYQSILDRDKDNAAAKASLERLKDK